MGHWRHTDPHRRKRVVTGVVVAVAVIVVLAAVVIAVRLRRRRPDGVEQFQRQIGALSPAARRPVVDQVQQLDTDGEEATPPGRIRLRGQRRDG
ncbi:hypothetical protein BH18ACT2_BH18ACT2_21940 [soil metagenome]